jgi:type II secretory pathway component PulK
MAIINKNFVNYRRTANEQGRRPDEWRQLGGVPLAKVLTECAETTWRRQLADEVKAIVARTDIGASEQLRLICEAVEGGGAK